MRYLDANFIRETDRIKSTNEETEIERYLDSLLFQEHQYSFS